MTVVRLHYLLYLLTYARLTLRAAVEFYLLSMAHVLVQTLPSVFSWLAHQRGALCGQTAFVELFAHDGAAQLCRTLARSAPGTPLESACAECSRETRAEVRLVH